VKMLTSMSVRATAFTIRDKQLEERKERYRIGDMREEKTRKKRIREKIEAKREKKRRVERRSGKKRTERRERMGAVEREG
jgi:hypothetical protein